MRHLIGLLFVFWLAEARPRSFDIVPSISFDPYILGGVEATPGEFPWQLSQEVGPGSWSHSCGACLLTPNAALSAAHCVDGQIPSNLRVIAGLYDRSDVTLAQFAGVLSYTTHEGYNVGAGTFPNDISIMTLEVSFNTAPAHIELLTLPPDNLEQFVGITCTLSGWGRTSSSNTLPDILHKVDIPVISTDECNVRMTGVIGADCSDSQIAVYDAVEGKGSCNGDSGGPMNCPLNGLTVVAGVTSWGVSGGGSCLPEYPSVYTRTASFLDWIAANTPAP